MPDTTTIARSTVLTLAPTLAGAPAAAQDAATVPLDSAHAEALGLDEDLGSVEAGWLADLVILDQNPVDDFRGSAAIHRVLPNGRMYDDDTLDEVWPRQGAAGPFYRRAEVAHRTPGAGIRDGNE